MKLLVVCLAVALYTHSTEAIEEAKYVCGRDANGNGEMVIDITMSKSFAKIYASGMATSCGTGVTTVPTTALAITGTAPGTTFSVTVNSVSDQTPCGITLNAGTKIADLTIYAQEDATIVQSTDIQFVLQCDFNNFYTEQAKTAQVTTAGSLTSGNITNNIPLTLEVFDNANTAVATTTPTLGDPVTLRATLTDTSLTVKKCWITDCVADKVATFANALNMFDANGCGVTTNALFANTDKFEADTSLTTANTKRYKTSTTFNAFRFVGSNNVFYQCKCQGCSATWSARCDTVTCPNTGRKRRAVESNNTTATAVTVTWVMSKVPVSNTNANVNVAAEKTMSTCLNHISFIAIVAILAMLLLISLGVSVFFCTKLTRAANQTPSAAYPNPAYKA